MPILISSRLLLKKQGSFTDRFIAWLRNPNGKPPTVSAPHQVRYIPMSSTSPRNFLLVLVCVSPSTSSGPRPRTRKLGASSRCCTIPHAAALGRPQWIRPSPPRTTFGQRCVIDHRCWSSLYFLLETQSLPLWCCSGPGGPEWHPPNTRHQRSSGVHRVRAGRAGGLSPSHGARIPGILQGTPS